jgi:hypothetical protein
MKLEIYINYMPCFDLIFSYMYGGLEYWQLTDSLQNLHNKWSEVQWCAWETVRHYKISQQTQQHFRTYTDYDSNESFMKINYDCKNLTKSALR